MYESDDRRRASREFPNRTTIAAAEPQQDRMARTDDEPGRPSGFPARDATMSPLNRTPASREITRWWASDWSPRCSARAHRRTGWEIQAP